MISCYSQFGKIVEVTRKDGVLVETPVAPSEYVAFFDELPKGLIGTKVGNYWKVTWRDYDSRQAWVETHPEIKSYEGDVTPTRRYIADHDVTIEKPRRLYLDIETDSRVTMEHKEEARVLSWCAVDEDGREYTGILTEDTIVDERRLLKQLWQTLYQYDQIVTWGGDDFDQPVIEARTEACQLKPTCKRRLLWLDHLQAFKRLNMHSAESGDEKTSFKLNHIAQTILGEGKHDVEGWKTYEIWQTDPDRLLRYNLQDVILLKKIEEKTGYLTLFQTLCEVCNVLPNSHGLKPTAQVDGLLLRMGRELGVRMPTRIRRAGEDQFEGAYVMEPRVTGIEKNVHVGDFKSLYPSIIMSWNLGPDTKDPSGTCKSPSTGMLSTVDRDGFFPMALVRLLDLRKHWAKKKDTLPKGTPEWHAAMQKSTAYKVAANSFYGVLGSSYSRFFDKLVATSVTQNGKWLILKTIEAAESHGWRVIYADTDSIFVVGPSKEEFESFVGWCNTEYYPKLLGECGCKKNYICLNFEKTLERIIFPRSSTGEYAAKRYAAKYDGSAADAKPEIKGLEYKRGDSLKLARSFQWEIIQVLMSGCEDPDVYEKMVQDKLRHVFYGDIALADIVQSKSVSRPLETYKAKGATHIRIAEEMKEAGEDIRPGVRVEYVVVDGDQSPVEAIPASEYAGEFDRRWAWNKHVYPPTMRLLAGAFPGRNWARWQIKKTKPKSQTSLFSSGSR